MRAWLIKKGTKGHAVKFNGVGSPNIDAKTLKEETYYFEEDVAVDPIGKFGCGPGHNTIGGDWARKGFYGFKLPKNKSGYDILLVHSTDIIIG
jgi:hypothetical protein